MTAGSRMFKRTAVGAAVASAICAANCASAQDRAGLEEIVVTATKQAENLQEVPLSVQVLDSTALEELRVNNFADYLLQFPTVNAGGRGPGQSTIFMRGLATTVLRLPGAEIAGSAPNVAVYLDEQPITSVGRNLDVYVTDMERIEVLPGPQGTLFGASAQAGAIRLITKKPRLNEFEAGFDASQSFTEHGDPSTSLEGYINVPVIDDRLALRLAAYDVQQGGYIDNVAASMSLPESNPNFPEGATLSTVSNAELVEDNFNDASYEGFRLGAYAQFTPDWSGLLQVSHQILGVDGVFDHDPTDVGELKVRRFFLDELEDEFNQIAWTVQGRLAALNVIYTGGYLDRDVDGGLDYTGYAESGPFMPYYTCDYPNYTACGSPVAGGITVPNTTHETHEFRLSTPEDKRTRLIAGVFYEDLEQKVTSQFVLPGMIDQGFAPNAPVPGATHVDPNPRPLGVAFVNDFIRTLEQYAVFGELSFDLTDQWTITAGARYYDMEVDLVGSSNFAQRGVDTGAGVNFDTLLADVRPLTESDTIFKGNITYRPAEDLLFYATYSEGFRPGLFNRNSAVPGIPRTVTSDDVQNYEIGFKSMLADGNLRLNGTLYFIDWTDIQVGIFAPTLSNQVFGANIGEAEIQGFEGDAAWSLNDNLTLYAAVSYNDTELTEVPPFVVNIAPEGSELALTPPLQFNVRGRYEWNISEYRAYGQASVIYADSSYSSIVLANRFKQDSWTMVNGSLGITHDNWGAELFVDNLTDKRAELFINDQDSDVRTVIPRPRTIGLRITYDTN